MTHESSSAQAPYGSPVPTTTMREADRSGVCLGSSTPTGDPHPAPRPRQVRTRHLAQMRERGEKIVMLTAYDALTAAILDAAGTDVLLVGDSIGNVCLGYDSTLPVTLEDMTLATRSVARAAQRALVVADLPFGSYEAGPAQALDSAVTLMKVGAHAVKLEGGQPRVQTVRTLVDAGIPVMAHVGFTPQSIHTIGGYRVQGRGEAAADQMVSDVQALGAAGAFAVVLEMVPEPVSQRVTELSPIPTIGIGAGRGCNGQVLVWSDMAGMTQWTPRFARQFGQVGEALRAAAQDFGQAVREGHFPGPEHCFDS